jgi:hypothetical protein
VQQGLLAIKSGARSLTLENVEDAAPKAMPRWIGFVVAAAAATILVTAAYIGRTAFIKAPSASSATVARDAKSVQNAKQDQDIVSLDEKDIANEIQDEVDRDPEEAHFKLRYFRATDETLAPLARLWKLRSVDLSCSKIGDNGLAYIEKCPLEILILAETQVTDAGMVHVANMKRLETLDLYDTKVSNSGLAHLAGVTSIRVLKIGGTQITGDGLENLLPLKSLKELDVNDLKDGMTEKGLATISKFANLTQLNLGGDRITATGIAALANLPKLGNLCLARTNLSAGEIDALAKLKHLEVLDLEATPVTIKDLNTLAKELPSLEQLCIENCGKISQSDRQQFMKRHPRIQFVAPQILPDLQKAENLFFPHRSSKQAK